MTEPTTLAEHRRAKRIARKLKTIDLDALEVAAPCPASWDALEGDDRSRFCGQCEKNVFDFRRLTRDEIATLLAQADEQVCGRLYRRADGTVITADCPVGLTARLHRRLMRLGALATALLLVVLGLFGMRKTTKGQGCGGPGFFSGPDEYFDAAGGIQAIPDDERAVREARYLAQEEAKRRAEAEARRQAERDHLRDAR